MKRRLTLSFLSFLFLFSVRLDAAKTDGWTHYPFSGCYYGPGPMVQDGDFVWIGSCKGLIKLNKKNGATIVYDTSNTCFTSYYSSNTPFPGFNITALTKDSQGAIWVGILPAGVFKIKNDTCSMVDTSRKSHASVPLLPVCMMEDHDKNIWVGYFLGSGVPYPGGLRRYTEQGLLTFATFDSFPAQNGVIDLLDDTSAAGIWIAGQNYGMFRYDGLNIKKDSAAPGLLSMQRGNKDTIFGGAGYGLFIYDGAKWSNVISINAKPYPHNRITDLLQDRAGRVWVTTVDDGLEYYANGQWTLLDSTNSGFNDSTANYLSLDSSGAVWISSYSGLTVYKGPTAIDPQSRAGNRGAGMYPITVNGAGNNTVFLRYALPREAPVSICLYTMQGSRVWSTGTRVQPSGRYSVPLTNDRLSSGSYLLVFRAGEVEKRQKVTIIR